jgi:3-oxoacyl-[acyl-carrier-protein] synthase-1
LSTTKGNVEYVGSREKHERIPLHVSAKHIAAGFGIKHHLVVSNACISGVLALATAQRFLLTAKYRYALVVGAEVLSPFIISGFRSLFALDSEPCKPFDERRSGINLGEGAGAVLLTTDPTAFLKKSSVAITGIGLSNDANHISGPSRTGKELALAIKHSLHAAALKSTDIDFISAHGTATKFNDEMEARAFTEAGMQDTPLNSLKGYYGHTLGAAGTIETIITAHALLRNEIIGTKGFEKAGVSMPVNVVGQHTAKPVTRALKTASGFGGCNAALVLEKFSERRNYS